MAARELEGVRAQRASDRWRVGFVPQVRRNSAGSVSSVGQTTIHDVDNKQLIICVFL